MDSIFEHYKRTGYLHHAHIMEGAHIEVVPELLSAIERHMGIVAKGNPDLMVIKCQSLGVSEARLLKEAQIQSSFSGGRRIFIIGAESFTHEAQNALLKTFEEPTVGTHFFIIVPHLATILPTIKSRVIIIDGRRTSVKEDDTRVIAEKFLDSNLEQRFAIAKKQTEVKKGEQVDREKIRHILDHIERILYTRMAGPQLGNPTSKLGGGIFREIFQAKTYLADRGSSAKMLLDHLAIVIY